jgi:hypothetical protein
MLRATSDTVRTCYGVDEEADISFYGSSGTSRFYEYFGFKISYIDLRRARISVKNKSIDFLSLL